MLKSELQEGVRRGIEDEDEAEREGDADADADADEEEDDNDEGNNAIGEMVNRFADL